MIANTRKIFDERCHARQSPQSRPVSLGRRTGHQRLGDLLSLLGCEFGFAARRPLADQGSLPALLPRILPTISHLPRYHKTARHLRCGETFVEEGGSFFPAFFHLGMISCLRHAQTIDRRLLDVTNNMSLYCARLNRVPAASREGRKKSQCSQWSQPSPLRIAEDGGETRVPRKSRVGSLTWERGEMLNAEKLKVPPALESWRTGWRPWNA